jgi:hypothetical protein
MAQDQRGTDTLPLVVKPISGRDNPLHVEQPTEWLVFYAALGIGILQLIVFSIQSYLLWDTILSSNLPTIIVRRIVIDSPNIDNRPATQPFRQNDTLCGRFTFINVGRRKATVADTYSMFFLTDKALPMKPPYDDAGTPPRLNITLPPGWSDGTRIIKSITIETIPNDPHWRRYVMGWIDCIYKPLPWRWIKQRCSVSRVYFCRVWSPRHYRFIPVDNPDYESEQR